MQTNLYIDIINKNILSLIKKYPYLKEYKEDLFQQGYLYVDKAFKSYDESKNKSIEFWINLNVSSGLRNYVFREIMPHIFNVKFTNNFLNSISYEECYLLDDIYNSLELLDKFILYMVIMNNYSYSYLYKKYNIPINYIENVVSNLKKYFKYGEF